jgi:hypothetical protein
MTVASINERGDFNLGNVLNRAFRVCTANFVLFFAVTLVIGLPNLIFYLQTPVDEPSLYSGFSFLIATLVGVFLNTIGEAVILYGAFQSLRGQPVVLGDTLRRGLARFFPIIGFAILYTLGLFVGFIFLVVPGIILFIIWTVALPACVVEGLGPIQCMQRSTQLTKGYRWKIFGIMLLLMIISWIVGGIIGAVLIPAGSVVKAIGNLIWTAAWSAYWNCVLVMIYHDLRVAKEGIDTEQIASIFD